MRLSGYLASLLLPVAALAQEHTPKNELAFQLGGFTSTNRGGTSSLRLGSGMALQSNFARRIVERRSYAIYGEVHFLASPQRVVSSSDGTATRDIATLYLTPGVRVKFAPHSRVSPYLASGAGLAWYEQSRTHLNVAPNAAPRELLRGAVGFGGGVDVGVLRWLALRAEIRDFYTGAPAYNVASVSGGQHNVVVGAAFVIRWRE